MATSKKSSSDTKQSARERAAQARAAAEAADRRRDRAVRLSIAAVVVVVIGGIIAAVLLSTRTTPVDENVALPAGVTSGSSGAPVGTATTPVLDIYEDFQCPACAAFEAQTGSTIDALVAEGKVRVNYHPMNFLDLNLGNDSSTLAASAFGCAVDAGKTSEYHSVVFANQPVGEGTGFTKDQLKEFGAQVGITGEQKATFDSCVDNITYGGWADLSNAEAGKAGVSATPTLKLDGVELTADQRTPEALRAKIEAAAGQ